MPDQRPDEPADEAAGSPRTSELAADYRSHREQWLARGDELERLRADVRIAAQREAAEIVTRARQDIRRTLTSARRDLIELNAQVKAAGAASDAGPIDLDLAGDVRALLAESGWPEHPRKTLTAGAGEESQYPSDVVMVTSGAEGAAGASPVRRSLVAILAAFGIVVVAGIFWLVVRPPTANAPETNAPEALPDTSRAAVPSPAAVQPPTPAPSLAAPSAASSGASSPTAAGPWIEIEAVREVWMRVTIDGVADAGRTYAAGETRRVDGGSQIAVRVGDGAAATVAVNGGMKAPFGPEGLPITRRFARQ